MFFVLFNQERKIIRKFNLKKINQIVQADNNITACKQSVTMFTCAKCL